MLIKFNFSNYKSFENYTTLDMLATTLKEHQNNLIEVGDDKIAKIAAIYGANGSGKTVLFEALQFMSNFVSNSFKYSNNNEDGMLSNFDFNPYSEKLCSFFEVFIKYEENEYQYGFELDNNKISKEWLYKRAITKRKNLKYTLVFDRVGKDIKLMKELQSIEGLKEILRDNILFISICLNLKVIYIKDVINWFGNIVCIKGYSYEINNYVEKIVLTKIENRAYQKEVVRFLKLVDSSIQEIHIEKVHKKGIEEKFNIYFTHKLNNEDKVIKLSLNSEPSGVQRIFIIYNLFRHSIQQRVPIFIDEIDTGLHPLLIEYIIDMFQSEKNTKEFGQLVYTSHSVFTLNKEKFRRDQIWFVEKEMWKSSILYSLANYKINDKKVRNDASYSKDYLAGKYGAIPKLTEF